MFLAIRMFLYFLFPLRAAQDAAALALADLERALTA